MLKLRDALSGIDLDALFRLGREIIKRVGRPKDLLAVKVAAGELLRKPGSRYVADALAAFTSRDKLHERTAPLFLDKDQVFIRGDDLKDDLAKLDAHYSQLSDEEKLRGVMSFAHYPPVEGDFLVSKMWDKLMRPEWRESPTRQPELRSIENDAKIIAEINEIADSPRSSIKASDLHQDPDAVLVQRKIPLYRGKWRMVSPEVEKSSAR